MGQPTQDRRGTHECIGSGPPLLFVNALYQPRQTWEPIIARLSESYTCICFDLPNQNLVFHGATAQPDCDTPEAYEAAILQTIDACGFRPEQVIACGLSSGANHLRHLHHTGGVNFRGLVLLGLDPPSLSKFHLAFNIECQSVLEAAGVERYSGLINFWFFSQTWINTNAFAIRYIKRRYAALFEDGQSVKALLRAAVAAYRRPIPADRFRCPTALINGTRDALCPADAMRAYAAEIGAHFGLSEGAHSFPLENAEGAARAIHEALGMLENTETLPVQVSCADAAPLRPQAS